MVHAFIGFWIAVDSLAIPKISNIVAVHGKNGWILVLDGYLYSPRKKLAEKLVELEIKRIYAKGNRIYFLTRNTQYPLLVYDVRTETLDTLDLSGFYSDLDVESGIVLSFSNMMNTRTKHLYDMKSYDIHGRRILSFMGKLLFIDKQGYLRDTNGNILSFNVLDAIAYRNKLAVLRKHAVDIYEDGFERRYTYNLEVDGLVFYPMHEDSMLLLAFRKDRLLLIKDAFWIELLNVPENIRCVLPLNYDMEGSFELVVSTDSLVYIYKQTEDTYKDVKVVLDTSYALPSTCGYSTGLKLHRKRKVEEYPWKLRISYMNDGIEVMLKGYNEDVLIKVVDRRGVVVYEKTVRGKAHITLTRRGVYTLSIQKGGIIQNKLIIWRGR